MESNQQKLESLAEALGMIAEPYTGPLCEQHTASPGGYLQWHSWAARMSRTHRQVRCTFCGLWEVWVPRKNTNAK